MQHLGLTAAQYRAFLGALADPHSIRLDVAVLNLSGQELSRISPEVLDGQVDVDADADVTRSLTMTFLDPSHALHLDSDSPDDGAMYADRMLQVTYSVLVPALDDRVDVEVFTGPILTYRRTGATVEVSAHGKEEFGLGWIWRPLTIKKGGRKTDAIRTILKERTGERRFDIPDLPARLPRAVVLGRQAMAWPRARKIAASVNRQLYYDGTGTCRLRVRPRRPVLTFRADHMSGSNITGPVTVTHDFTTIKNAVWFKGGKPKGQKKAIEVFVPAPITHPLSPHKLGRDNADGDRVPRYLVEERVNDQVRSKAEARRRGEALLEDLLTETLGVEFTAFPMPHLDPLDVVRVETGEFTANVRIRRFSLPLAAGGQMTIGYLRRVSRPKRRRIRGR